MKKSKYNLNHEIIYNLLLLFFLLPFIPVLIFIAIIFFASSWKDFLEIFGVNIDIFYEIFKKSEKSKKK